MDILRKSTYKTASLLILLFVLIVQISCSDSTFNSTRAYSYIDQQISFGYRIPGSQASKNTSIFIRKTLEDIGWKVSFQDFEFEGVALRNIIALNKESEPEIILGTHYDTRQMSDHEKTKSRISIPVMGANDGASGTALLLELSRQLKTSKKSICLVFFDAEDQGGINGWQWNLGAEYFASQLSTFPKAAVILDMVGDKYLNIFKENNSNQTLTNELWNTADKLGYNNFFIDQSKFALIDDHLPFLNRGIPSVLIIDFDYPYWHSNEDTLDKVSGKSLEKVAEVLKVWITSGY